MHARHSGCSINFLDWYVCRSLSSACLGNIYETYNNLRESDANFEVIYVSNDLQRIDFNNCFQNMPWLSFPFDIKDTRRSRLLRKFKIETAPEIVVISPNGICLKRQAKKPLVQFRDDAYPYSDFDLKDPSWKHVRNVAHSWYEDEELQRLLGAYKCNIYGKEGWGWFYFGEEIKSSFHLRCLLAKLESNWLFRKWKYKSFFVNLSLSYVVYEKAIVCDQYFSLLFFCLCANVIVFDILW